MLFKPHEYQQRAIDWVIEKPRCNLFLGCGLGKSVITLTAMQRLIDFMEVERVLVVAPKKVAETTWSCEAQKWKHLQGLRVVKVLGTEKKRKEALRTSADVYVTSRDNFVWLCGQYGGVLPFDAVVIDELTSFKSAKSQRFKAMRIATASVKRVVGLTGTPAPNGLQDLWAQMYCVDMGARLGKSITRYRETYFTQQRWNNITIRMDLRKGAEQTIREKIKDICLTMQAKDYLTLPPLHEITHYVELPEKIMRGYLKFEEEQVLAFKESNADKETSILAGSAAALMNKLAQYASGAVYDEDHASHEIHTEKLEHLREIVESATAESGVLVFYQYKHDIERITEMLKGYRVRLYGSETDLRAWNSHEVDVLLAHPSSTAYGLNMQEGGNVVVWMGTGWNLELYQQANARLHRQGQAKPVTVYRLICRGTVEERACKAIESKHGVQQALLNSLNDLYKKYGKTS